MAELARLAANEPDPEKMMALAKEINELLEQQQAHLDHPQSE